MYFTIILIYQLKYSVFKNINHQSCIFHEFLVLWLGACTLAANRDPITRGCPNLQRPGQVPTLPAKKS